MRDYPVRTAERVRRMGPSNVDTHTADGYPGTAIVDEVGHDPTKLVVMTTHGRSDMGRWVLGSVTDRVIRHSAGPVLVIPARG